MNGIGNKLKTFFVSKGKSIEPWATIVATIFSGIMVFLSVYPLSASNKALKNTSTLLEIVKFIEGRQNMITQIDLDIIFKPELENELLDRKGFAVDSLLNAYEFACGQYLKKDKIDNESFKDYFKVILEDSIIKYEFEIETNIKMYPEKDIYSNIIEVCREWDIKTSW
jgi:hypothetical protein